MGGLVRCMMICLRRSGYDQVRVRRYKTDHIVRRSWDSFRSNMGKLFYMCIMEIPNIIGKGDGI